MVANLNTIIISRTDGIGDVVLTLPICGIIKKRYPECKILFLGRTYTEPVIQCCEHVDGFLNADELSVEELKKIHADAIIHVFPKREIARMAKEAGIKIRIGTTNRIFHWGTVNKMVRLSRKNSSLHEAQLNCKLLIPLGINILPNLQELAEYMGFTRLPSLNNSWHSVIEKDKIKVILHPKSNKNGREWSLDNYTKLIKLMPPEKFQIFVSGSDAEHEILKQWTSVLPPHVVDISGKLSLPEFISFISRADFLIAAGTGPLHLAAAIGIGAIGIFPPIKPINPSRWQPIGRRAEFLCIYKECSACRQIPQNCLCMDEISAQQVFSLINK